MASGLESICQDIAEAVDGMIGTCFPNEHIAAKCCWNPGLTNTDRCSFIAFLAFMSLVVMRVCPALHLSPSSSLSFSFLHLLRLPLAWKRAHMSSGPW